MKSVLIVTIGLASLSILVPGARAQQQSTTVTLVQTLRPAVRSYPGVAADILGVRTGMTASQAEAIAEKNYPGKPQEYTYPVSITYRDVTVQSHPYVRHVHFNQVADSPDTLSLHFSSPVTGNTLYEMTRLLTFYNADSQSALNAPLISTIEASLIRKYGPPTYRESSYYGQYPVLDIAWVFTQKSRILCNNSDCVENGVSLDQRVLSDHEALMDEWQLFPTPWCGAPIHDPNLFSIVAKILGSPGDNAKAWRMWVSIGDGAACMNDSKVATKQLKADAIKFYNSVSKAPAAPKF